MATQNEAFAAKAILGTVGLGADITGATYNMGGNDVFGVVAVMPCLGGRVLRTVDIATLTPVSAKKLAREMTAEAKARTNKTRAVNRAQNA